MKTHTSVRRLKMRRRDPKDYSSTLQNSIHAPIRTWSELKKQRWGASLAFFYRGEHIGYGELSLKGRTHRHVHTCAVALNKADRNQGHGIHLYHALIERAKRLGATRIYSDTRLNKYSTRMWAVKLAAYYDVKTLRTGTHCPRCAQKWKRPRFYIDLEAR